MEAARSTVVLALLAFLAPDEAREIRSANGRFLARVRPPAAIEVVEASDAAKTLWSASGLALAPASDWRLADDGRALVAIAADADARKERERPLVQVVRDGKLLVSLRADALGLRGDAAGAWLPDDAACVRLRAVDREGGTGYRLDLLARDERVRTVDLETGAVRLPREESPPGPVRVEPLASEGAEPAFVGEWFAPEAIFAGEPFPVHVRGSMPTPAWKFAGFSLEIGAAPGTALVLTPLATLPAEGTISIQVLKGFEGTALILGLQPGVVSIEVRGRDKPEGGQESGPRSLRVLGTETIAWMQKSGGIAGIRESVALFEDGRLERVRGRRDAARLLVLATDEERATVSRVLGRLPSAPRPRARTVGNDLFEYELAWIVDGHPIRALRNDQNLEPELRALVDAMSALVPAQDERQTYAIDPIRSRIEVRTGSGGILSAFGHDHRLMVQRLGGEVKLDPGSLARSSATVTVEAGSLAVVDDESQEDRVEIEKEMNRRVLEVAKFPEIVFRSRAVEVRSGDASSCELTVEGELALHGVARTIRVPLHVETKGTSLHATGRMRVTQSDYGISRTSAVGGTVKVADEVDLSIDILAVR